MCCCAARLRKCSPSTCDLASLCRASWIKPGAVVIDVGINVVRHTAASGTHASPSNHEARLVGDVAFDEASRVAGALTPVPGGVGPMTIAALVHNVVLAARYSAHLPWTPDVCSG